MNTQCRLLLTRPRVKSAIFTEALEKAAPGRFACIAAPVLEIVPLEVRITTAGVQGVLFTSATAVELAVQNADLRDLPCLCVGPATARAAGVHGLDVTNAEGDAGDMLRAATEMFKPGAGRLVHVRGVHASRDIASELTARGLETQSVVIYDQRPLPISKPVADGLAAGRFDAIAFFSPRSAEIFVNLAYPGWVFTATDAFCLSPAIANALQNLRFCRVFTADSPNSPAMIDCLTARCDHN